MSWRPCLAITPAFQLSARIIGSHGAPYIPFFIALLSDAGSRYGVAKIKPGMQPGSLGYCNARMGKPI